MFATTRKRLKVKLIVHNASGTQALTLRGLSNPGVLHFGVVSRETVSRYTVITHPGWEGVIT